MATRWRILFAGLLGALLVAFGGAHAQDYPTKPIRMVVTAAPGGITDILARIMAEAMPRSMGQPMIVDNKPGAGGNIGTEFVVKSAPDGYTLVIVNVGTIAIHHWIYKAMPFDSLNDLIPVAPVADGVSIIGVNAKLPARTLRELIDYAIVEGAMIKAPHLIHYLQMARLEIDHWRPPCPTCGRPMRDRGD